jgi:hypothetical protein
MRKLKNMNNSLLVEKEKQLHADGCIRFRDEEWESFSVEDLEQLEKHFHGHAMVRLPDYEIEFFEWLKKNDEPVWNDLWQGDDDPYLVSSDFIHHFGPEGNGFPICDLEEVDNYWFHSRHIKPKGMERLQAVKSHLSDGTKMKFEETLLAEIMRNSIDLWHFCYMYRAPLVAAKARVAAMHRDDLLVHLSNRDDLVKYLDI